MGEAEQPVASPIVLTEKQLDDFAELLVRYVNPGNRLSLATSVLGAGAEQLAGNDIGDPLKFARRIAAAFQDAGQMPAAEGWLRELAHINSPLIAGLNRIMNGDSLPDEEALQKFVNEFEPFLSPEVFEVHFPRVSRTVCAVALGKPTNSIVGSGFLIQPDLVMTNYHVLETFLKVDPVTKKIEANGPGDQIFFFFDYKSLPSPDVPPSSVQTSLAVTAAADWLVHARQPLRGDGTPDVQPLQNKEYDYAIVRLARRVGALSVRKGGGNMRGWLSLPQQALDVLGAKGKRIIVFQHPQKAPQRWDIGDYERLDLSTSRVWYRVNTAHGSSGGAAVDSDGQLFALHNAEVRTVDETLAGLKLNQGVRIDKIAEDLRVEAPDVLNSPALPQDDNMFWSLNDDLQNSSPIIGRRKFRELINDMMAPNAERVLVVTGPPQSGLQYSIKLLKHAMGLRPVVVFSPNQLRTNEPKQFLKAVAQDLNILGLAGNEIPDVLSTENISRWLRLDLPKWLKDRLSEDEQRNRAKYPAWIVINTVVPENDRLLWADNLKDCVAALIGAYDPGQPAIDIPQLRWLFVAQSAGALPTGGVKQLEDDLNKEIAYNSEFADCFQLAYRSIDKQASLPEPLLMNMADFTLQTNARLPQNEQLPPRKALADYVRELIKKDRQTGN